jgi:MFS family permease
VGVASEVKGLFCMPLAAAMMLASPLGGALTGKVESRYIIFASTLIASVGIYMLSFLDPKSTALDIIIPLSIMAFGLGFGMAQRTNVIASVVDPHEIGIASSVLALVRNISGAVGIALFSTILSNRISTNMLTINRLSTLNSNNPIDIQKYISLVGLKAQIGAYNHVFLISSIIVFVGAFISLSIKIKKERVDIKVLAE